MHLTQSAFLGKRCIVEIIGLYSKIGGDMITDHHQPLALLFIELLAG